MRRHTVFALGLALALPCAGAWAVDASSPGNGANAGTELQAPAPANPNAPVPQDQAQPNAPTPDQSQANPASPNGAAPNAEPANPAPATSSVPGEVGTTTTPTYYSPLQQFASQNVDEIGELSNQLTQFRAANRPDAVMVLYHMIRDHRLAADAAENILARRGDISTPTITVMQPMANTPADMIRADIQQHQQMASGLQQMISNANTDADRHLYQQALNITNKHLQWLQSLDQGQQVSLGFFGPTTPLGALSGATTIAAANGYPQPTVTQRTAAFRQQVNTRRNARARRMRRGRYSRVRHTRRYRRSRRMSSYGY